MPGNGAVQRAVALRPLAQMIIEIERPHPVRVGVDGFSGAGKSTLADELAAMVTGQGRPCLRADLDDFKRPRAERPAGPEGFYRGAFDLDRPNARQHLSFGFGIHTCPGAPLARAEGCVSVERLLDRLGDIRISEAEHGPPDARHFEYVPTYILRGVQRLHLEFTPRAER